VDGGSGNDFDRVNRQQEILELVFQKVSKEMNEQSVFALITFATRYISTNMTSETMTKITRLLLGKGMSIMKSTIPAVGSYSLYVDEEGNISDLLAFDIDATSAELITLIYGDSFVTTPASE
jgi:anionic cell wall polymer biosynthesis LytR-Cps2A-Psr (LCP) family protein